tara:strand:+ start:1355 stop:2788 length:1434 start_codon:yes stop_codon:yes gene_type:complete
MDAQPSILQSNAMDETQSTRVESIIQEADNHSWVSGTTNGFGKSKFVLQKKGSALAPNGSLIWKVLWNKYDTTQDRFASLVRTSGGVNMIRNVRLYMGGKLISETRECGQKIALENLFVPYDAQVEILDEKTVGNHQYFYDETGELQLADDKLFNEVGFRSPTNDNGATIECSVKISQLLPVLKDTSLPSNLSSDIIIEIDWNGIWGDIMVESGAVAFTNTERVFEITRPRLHLDYITYADEIANALNNQMNSADGMTIPYRQEVLVNSILNASNAGTSQTTDVELGFANRSVMKIYVQKLLQGNTNPLLRNTRSDGLYNEQLQLVVNNRNLYDRDVVKVSEMYSYLGQTKTTPAYLLPCTYNQFGLLGANNIMAEGVNLPCKGTFTSVDTVRANIQGQQRYLGINLAKTRVDNDTPQNAIQVGESPMVLRISRTTNTDTDEESPNAIQQSACNLNIWVECVRAIIIRNGVIDVINL